MELDENYSASNFDDVIETLINMFGDSIGRDVVYTVVESVDGDLNHAANILMNMMNDNNSKLITTNDNHREISENESILDSPNVETAVNHQPQILVPKTMPQSSMRSYSATASAFNSNTRPDNRQPERQISIPRINFNEKTRIQENHIKGSRILILLRGVPGSGKSYLAKTIVEITVGNSPALYKKHILSTDDYFMNGVGYQFDKSKLSYAHRWNQDRAVAALKCGISPVIIDNTNVELWEMQPYFEAGVENGYIIEVVEPNTAWAKKAHILCKKNCHNVSFGTIKRMLENFKSNITADDLFNCFNCHYPPSLTPPQLRNIPAFTQNDETLTVESITEENNITSVNEVEPTRLASVESNIPKPLINSNELTLHTSAMISDLPPQPTIINIFNPTPHTSTANIIHVASTSHNSVNTDEVVMACESEVKENALDLELKLKYMNIQQQLEEMQKIEQEWENGESWDEIKSQEEEASTSSIQQKLPKVTSESSYTEILAPTAKRALESAKNWSDFSMFLPPWGDENNQNASATTTNVVVEKKSTSTCIELGDTDMQCPKPEYKVLIGKYRDINFDYVPNQIEKIPEKRMLDKSTITKGEKIHTYRCKNEEKHFAEFRKLFKTLPKPLLRDIFDQCCGDVNWAVDIVLDGVDNDTFKYADDDNESDPDDSADQECDCLAAYDIIPDINAESVSETLDDQNSANLSVVTVQQRKTKKESNTSESSLQLKRQLEEIVVFSENHYSNNYLKIRKLRRGDGEESRELSEPIVKHSEVFDEKTDKSPKFPPLGSVASTSKQGNVDTNAIAVPSTSKQDNIDGNAHIGFESAPRTSTASFVNGEESDNDEFVDNPEQTVPLKLNLGLFSQLDKIFGGNGFTCDPTVETQIDLPISIANQMYALWLESLANQFDENHRQTAQMIKEDEEFARELERKENEIARSGEEPDIPDFKEIMDMDMAISLYQKDVAEWRNNIPEDLAAKLTRDKLFNLFPEVGNDVLTELLMAHGNSFHATVEALLVSTGKTEILESENGINKFVMEKELEIKNQLLEEERKALNEADWPLLPGSEPVDMSTVQRYRTEAQMHLATRNQNYVKAQSYVRRGMLEVANYYSTLANFHRKKYEHANSLAALTLVQAHTQNNPKDVTIDLHYLHVKEARECLDLYIDNQITKLKENCARTGVRVITLYFITGRGLHSMNGRSRLKPAVKKRLRERGIRHTESNPGLVNAEISVDTQLSHLIPPSA